MPRPTDAALRKMGLNPKYIGGDVMDDIRAFEKEHPDKMAYALWVRREFKRQPKQNKAYHKGFLAGFAAARRKK